MRNNVLYKFVLGTRGQKRRLIVKISEKLVFTHFSKEKNSSNFSFAARFGAVKGEVVMTSARKAMNSV